MKWRDRINRNYMQISLYTIITAVIIYCLGLVVKNVPGILQDILDKLSWFLGVIKPVILGFVFAYLMDPVVDFFEKKYRKIKIHKLFKRMYAPRTWAAVTAVALVLTLAIGLISLLVFSVTDQMRLASLDDIIAISEEFRNSLTLFYGDVMEKLDSLDIQSVQIAAYVKQGTDYMVNTLIDFAKNSLTSVTNISGYLTTFIFSFITGIYFMIDGRMIINYVNKVCRALLSHRKNHQIHGMMRDLDEVFSGYIRGQLMDAVFMMFAISVALSVTGVKFALVIGIFSGIGNLVPYFGPVVAYASTIIVCLIDGKINTLVISVIVLFVIQAIDGNLVGPKLLSRCIEIHPLLIIISLIFGSAVGGFLGMLLAVPLGAYCKMIFVRFIDNRLQHKEQMRHEDVIEEEKKKGKASLK